MILGLFDLLVVGGAAFLIRKKLLRGKAHWALGLVASFVVWWAVFLHLFISGLASAASAATLPALVTFAMLGVKAKVKGHPR